MARQGTRTGVAIVVLMAIGALSACGANPSEEIAAEASIQTVSAHRTSHLDWEKSWENAFTRAKSEGKPVLVSFGADWCVWCKKLESTTYRDANVMSLIAASVVPLSLDVDGAGGELSDVHGVESLPTVLVFDSNGEEKGRINGYLPPGRFVEVVNGILQES